MRTPTSYFRPYRKYFTAIYASFFAMPARELVIFFRPDETLLRYSSQLMVAAAITIAVLWGYLTTKLYLHPHPFSIRGVIADPGRPIHLGFFLYLIPLAVTEAASLVVADAVASEPGREALYQIGRAHV